MSSETDYSKCQKIDKARKKIRKQIRELTGVEPSTMKKRHGQGVNWAKNLIRLTEDLNRLENELADVLVEKMLKETI